MLGKSAYSDLFAYDVLGTIFQTAMLMQSKGNTGNPTISQNKKHNSCYISIMILEVLQELPFMNHIISDNEVCRNQTSAGINQQGQHIYVSKGLQDSGNDGVQINTAIDNFDQNEDTLDGKLTTHTMAAISTSNVLSTILMNT